MNYNYIIHGNNATTPARAPAHAPAPTLLALLMVVFIPLHATTITATTITTTKLSKAHQGLS